MIRYILLLLAAATLVSGCVKSREENFASQKPDGSAGAAGKSGQRSENARADEPETENAPAEESLLLEMENTGSETETETGSETALITRLDSGQRTLLALTKEKTVLPRDTEIGELQSTSRYSEPGTERIYTIVDAFLNGLTEGRVATEMIADDWRWSLESSLEDALDEGAVPGRYRLGEIRIEGTTARANIRLLSPRGRCSGEIFLANSGPEKGWEITDFQADLYELLEDYNVYGRFEPKMYDMTELF